MTPPFDNSHGPPRLRPPTPGERLFEFLHGQDRFCCELRDYAPYGIEAQVFQNEKFLHSRRFNTRALAVEWAEDQRTIIERGGA